jgi:hypothetical protein
MDKAGESLLDVIKASKDALDFIETEIRAKRAIEDSVAAFLDDKQNSMTVVQQWIFTSQIRLLMILQEGPQRVIDAMWQHMVRIERGMMVKK